MRVRWVKVWVDSLATLTERFRDDEGRVDFEAIGREEYAFRHALLTGDFSRSERARDLYDATINEITSRSEAGRKGAEARWSKKTAAATTREGVDVVTTSESCRSERTTGCNNSEAPQSPGGGRSPECIIAPSHSPKSEKSKFGEFGNVLLTSAEYGKLCERLDDADTLITELDQYIESQGKGRKYKSHYATLLNWSRRKAQESKPKQGYMTSDDISKKNYEESRARLEAMFSKGRETA